MQCLQGQTLSISSSHKSPQNLARCPGVDCIVVQTSTILLFPTFQAPGLVQCSAALSPVSTIPNSSSFVIRPKSKFGFSLAWIIINHYYPNYISYSFTTEITLCRFEAMEMSYKCSNVVPPPG